MISKPFIDTSDTALSLDKQFYYGLGNKDDIIAQHINAVNTQATKGVRLLIDKRDSKISFQQLEHSTILEISYKKSIGRLDTLRSQEGMQYDLTGFPIYKDDIYSLVVEGTTCPVVKIYDEESPNRNVVISLELPDEVAKKLINKIYKKDKIEMKYRLIEKGSVRIAAEKDAVLNEEDKKMIKNLVSIIKTMDMHGYENDTKLNMSYLEMKGAYEDFHNTQTWFQHELYILDFVQYIDDNLKKNLEKVSHMSPGDGISEILEANEENHKYAIGNYDTLYNWLNERKLLYQSFFNVPQSYGSYQVPNTIFYKYKSVKDYYKSALNNINLLGNL